MPDDGLEDRLAALALLQGLTTLLAVVAVLYFPITVQFAEPPEHYSERSSVYWDLVDPYWFSALLPVLTLPFVVAGLAFAGVFHRRKDYIGRLYGADLIGGAVGGLVFLPLLTFVAGPDTVFFIVGATMVSAGLLWRATGRRALAYGSFGVAGLLGVMSVVAVTGVELLTVHYSAGYSEEQVTYVRWTPLTRLALHDGDRGTYALLDNSSASAVILTKAERARMSRQLNRSLVYRLHEPPAKVAILASSAGPEIAVAQHYGFSTIDAIDIAAVGAVVADRFADAPGNPFTQPGVRQLEYDGRAAILYATEPYDIIQMVHANLHSAAGLMANAWSPSLLQSSEAFDTYLNHLTADGTIAFGRGSRTPGLYRAAWTALKVRGAEDPARHIAYVKGQATLMLVKKRPWSADEARQLRSTVATYVNQKVFVDPSRPNARRVQQLMERYPLITDDRPYFDTYETVRSSFEMAIDHFLGGGSEEVPSGRVVYYLLLIQTLFVAAMGLVLLVLPMLRREAVGLTKISGLGAGLTYVSCLGYGYLAVETVLIHELVLFVGHPVYALTTVVCTMLLASGLGSIWIQRVPQERRVSILRIALGVVVVLCVLQAVVVPPTLHAFFLGLPLAARATITVAVIAPLGFVMGIPFPLAMRILRPEAAGMVPWAWALNGWMSVVASLATIYVSRLGGYSYAFGVAIAAYSVALLLASRLEHIGLGTEPTERATSGSP